MNHALLILGCAIALLADVPAHALRDDAKHVISIPLNDGRLELREVVRPIADRLGAANMVSADMWRWSVDVHSMAGRLQIHALERLTAGAVELTIGHDALEIAFNESRIAEAALSTSEPVVKWLAGTLKFDPNRPQRQFGLTFVTANDPRASAEHVPASMRDRVVVLVHGLDDPGLMWADLIPELHAHGFTVARFEYPNDGPIAESADMFARALEHTRRSGIKRLDVVAHSMGGLVVRDVLSRRTYMNGQGTGDDRFPAIDRLIMCGTPNHGSALARFRSVIELREHLLTAIATPTSYRELSSADGEGEAGQDLLPGSEYLRRLNARPMPEHTRFTIIAARTSMVSGRQAQRLVGSLRSLSSSPRAPDWLKRAGVSRLARTLETTVDDAIDGVGDGCVSIESARLAGVDDFTIVRGGHLSMLLNVGGDDGLPPALRIILDRLATTERIVTEP